MERCGFFFSLLVLSGGICIHRVLLLCACTSGVCIPLAFCHCSGLAQRGLTVPILPRRLIKFHATMPVPQSVFETAPFVIPIPLTSIALSLESDTVKANLELLMLNHFILPGSDSEIALIRRTMQLLLWLPRPRGYADLCWW